MYNTTTGELILGHDPITGENYTYSDYGFLFSDPDKQVLLISREALPMNITVLCASTSVINVLEELNYTLIISDPVSNKTTVIGGLLSPGERASAVMHISPDGELRLERQMLVQVTLSSSEVAEGEPVDVHVSVLSDEGEPVSDARVEVVLGPLRAQARCVSAGEFMVTIDTDGLFGLYVVSVYVESEGLPPAMAVTSLRVLDETPPSIELLSPGEGEFVRANCTIRVLVEDKRLEVAELYIDGVRVACWNDSGLHEYVWDTTLYEDGPHTIRLFAADIANNTAELTITILSDNTPPAIISMSYEPQEPSEGEEVTVTVVVRDEVSGVVRAVLWVNVSGGWLAVEMTRVDDHEWRATIPAQPANTRVQFYVEVYDRAGNTVSTRVYTYVVMPRRRPSELPTALIGTVTGIAAASVAVGLYLLLKVRRRKGILHHGPGTEAPRTPENSLPQHFTCSKH